MSRLLSSFIGRTISSLVDISPEVRTALHEKKAVVALESTIISHGMPHPTNYETALSVQNIIREQGAVPATVAILGGRIKVGLDTKELAQLSDPGTKVVKVSRRDFSYVLSNKLNGATTVSGTLFVANKVGLKVFVTGGMGGVHRNGETTFDVSADLMELGRTPMMVISSGIKSILDIGKTLEYLETQGVSVVSYGPSKEFPAFYSNKSGHTALYNVETPVQAAGLLHSLQETDLNSGLLLAVPIPPEYSIPYEKMESTIQQALKEAAKDGIVGKDITPYILGKISVHTDGKSLESNIALIKNNAKVGGQVAVEYQKMQSETSVMSSGPVREKLKKPIVFGGSILDCTMSLEETFEMDGRTVNAMIGQSAGGVARNLADALGKLAPSKPPLFVSVVGDDLYGSFLLESIAHTDRSGVEVRKSARTACANVLFDKTGECRLILGDTGILSTISVQQVSAHEKSIVRSPLVVMDSNLPAETMDYILRICGNHNVPVWFEPTDSSLTWKPFKTDLWKNLRFISPNLNELKVISKTLGFSLDSELNLKDTDLLLNQLIHLASPLVQYMTVMVTMGSIGILMLSKVNPDEVLLQAATTADKDRRVQARFYPATKASNIVNVSGAGDCLAAGFMAGMLGGLSEPESVMLGVQAARDSLQSTSPVPLSFSAARISKAGSHFIDVR